MKPKKSFVVLVTMAIFMLLGLAACAPAAADAANNPPAAAPLDDAGLASFETRLARIELSGTLEQINAQAATVDGQTFRLDEQSLVVSALKPGDRVQVKAVLLPDNSLYAQSVKLDLSASSSSSFKFYGFVESMQSEGWQISSTFVQVNSSTLISGGIQTGSFVEVEGRVLNGQLVADKIQLDDDDARKATVTPGMPADEVEFYGKIESMQNGVYVIGGRTVRTAAQTEIKGMLAVGMMVKVYAFLQDDGSYLAREIELTSGDDRHDDNNYGKSSEMEFYGKIESMQNSVYVIGGRTVRTAAQTEIKGMLAVGLMVKVNAFLQDDGTYLAREIELTSGDDIYDDDNSGKSSDGDDDDRSDDNNSGKSGDDDDDDRSDDNDHDDGSDDDDSDNGDDDDSDRDDDDDDKGDDDDDKGKGK